MDAKYLIFLLLVLVSCSKTGILEITTTPQEAIVIIDDITIGKTPVSIDSLNEGGHTLIIKLSGYEDVTESIIYNNKKNYNYNYDLKDIEGTININSTPSNATVFLDGNKRGDTPLTLNNISKGKHYIRIIKGIEFFLLDVIDNTDEEILNYDAKLKKKPYFIIKEEGYRDSQLHKIVNYKYRCKEKNTEIQIYIKYFDTGSGTWTEMSNDRTILTNDLISVIIGSEYGGNKYSYYHYNDFGKLDFLAHGLNSIGETIDIYNYDRNNLIKSRHYISLNFRNIADMSLKELESELNSYEIYYSSDYKEEMINNLHRKIITTTYGRTTDYVIEETIFKKDRKIERSYYLANIDDMKYDSENVQYKTCESCFWVENIYNAYDMLIATNSTRTGGGPNYNEIFEYDLYGRLIREIYTDLWTGEYIHKTIYKYDDNDNRIKMSSDGIEDYYKDERNYYYDYIDLQDSVSSSLAPAITQILCSNWLTWDKNYYFYHPLKAFDGDPLTAWIEGNKDSGIGGYITLELDKEITCDRIEVSPGFFDKRWWMDNNRVKELEVVFGNEKRTMQFNDIMEPQSDKFKEPVKFRKISFYIKDVYRAAKSNDTAISEIAFYFKGKKVELDLTQVKGYLEQKTQDEVMQDIGT